MAIHPLWDVTRIPRNTNVVALPSCHTFSSNIPCCSVFDSARVDLPDTSESSLTVSEECSRGVFLKERVDHFVHVGLCCAFVHL